MRLYFYPKHFRPTGWGWIKFLARECRLQLHGLMKSGTGPLHRRLLAAAAAFCCLPDVALRSGRARSRLLKRGNVASTSVHEEANALSSNPPTNGGLLTDTIEFVIGSPVFFFLLAYRVGLLSFRTVSESLALIPGKLGVIWRRTWYCRTLHACGDRLVVEWMSVFKSPTASAGDRVYVGPFCWVSRTHLGDDVMLAGRVTILSGNAQHGTARIDLPMRQQPGRMADVRIGCDVWVGDSAVIMADVADGTVVGAGSVVTGKFEGYAVIAGNAARFIKPRGSRQETAA